MLNINNGIGTLIRKLRDKAKKSQETLADECGCESQSHLCKIECGKIDPHFSMVVKILDRLGYKLVVVKKD